MTFKEAFRQARAQGLQDFTWGKGTFNTKIKVKENGKERDETDEEWQAALAKNRPAEKPGITYTPGTMKDGKFEATGEPTTEFDKAKLFGQQEPVLDQENPFEPGTFNTSMTLNRDNVRANRGTNYSNVDQLWDYIGSNANSTEAQLFNNVLGGLEGDDRKNAFMQMMAKYKVKGNLGRRDSGRLANLLNDLSAIGTEGSEARKSYVDSFNKSFAKTQQDNADARMDAARQQYAAKKAQQYTEQNPATLSPLTIEDPSKRFMLGKAGASTLGDAGMTMGGDQLLNDPIYGKWVQ